jgi:hypothetical protein
MTFTAKPYILGTYRQHATVIVGEHSATVRCLSRPGIDPNGPTYDIFLVPEPPRNERYGVFDEDDTMTAICWRYGPPEPMPGHFPNIPHYDGGWQRAVALAEQLAVDAHTQSLTVGERTQSTR